MIFDRISLASAYKALKVVELNDGAIKDILFNKTSYYGTKTVDRFDTLVDLKNYINTNATYQHFDPECQCGISDNEAIWMPLSFNLTLPNNTYATFVNNMRGIFESAQEQKLNKLSIDALSNVFREQSELKLLKSNYSCFEYIQDQNRYISPCDYIEIIANDAYKNTIKLYKRTKSQDLSKSDILKLQNNINYIIANQAATTTTTTTTIAPCNAIGVDGYYPLYTTIVCAQQHPGGDGGYHSHDLGTPVTTYYMPNGLNMDPNAGPITQWHGDYGTTTTTQAPVAPGPQSNLGY